MAVDAPNYLHRTLFLVGGLLLFRLLYDAFLAAGPAGDEAYYWDWSRQLDYGYYSKPPMIAWLYALVDRVGGGSLFAIRATATLLGTLALLPLYALAADLFDRRTGWYAVLLGGLAPANAVLSYFLTIDAPLVFLWSVALWMFWRCVSGRGGSGSLILLFLALACGHLCKQMMMFFPVIAAIFLLKREEQALKIRRGAIVAALFLSYLSLIPPLLWNARHGWITFQHTSHHFESRSDGGNVILERVGDFFTFVGTQFGVLSPGTAFVLFSLCATGLLLLRRTGRAERFLLLFGVVPLAVMLLLALRQELQPNWAAVYYISGFVLVAAWYAGHLPWAFPPAAWRKLLPVTLAFSIALSGYFYAAPPVFAALGKAGHTADPNRRLLGVEDFAAGLQPLRERDELTRGAFLLVIGHRDFASHLAFHLPDRPRVMNLDTRPGINSQYEMWNLEQGPQRIGQDAILVLPGAKRLPKDLAAKFESVETLGEFETGAGTGSPRRFGVFLCRNLREWPRY